MRAEQVNETATGDEALSGLVDAALVICERRRQTLAHIKEAVEVGDMCEVYDLAKRLCGMEDEQACD